MYDKTAITFSVKTFNESGYTHTEVSIRSCYVNSVAEQLEGCVDNKAGFGSIEIANEVGERFRKMQEAGYESTYDAATGGLQLTIRWQHYKGASDGPDYCEPAFKDFGDGISGIEKSLAFLRKLGGAVEKHRARHTGGDLRKVSDHTFGSPERVIAVLAQMKGVVAVEYVADVRAVLVVRTEEAKAA
jgi:hypothetical protein